MAINICYIHVKLLESLVIIWCCSDTLSWVQCTVLSKSVPINSWSTCVNFFHRVEVSRRRTYEMPLKGNYWSSLHVHSKGGGNSDHLVYHFKGPVRGVIHVLSLNCLVCCYFGRFLRHCRSFDNTSVACRHFVALMSLFQGCVASWNLPLSGPNFKITSVHCRDWHIIVMPHAFHFGSNTSPSLATAIIPVFMFRKCARLFQFSDTHGNLWSL